MEYLRTRRRQGTYRTLTQQVALSVRVMKKCFNWICISSKGWFTLEAAVCIFRSRLHQLRDRKFSISLRKCNCPLVLMSLNAHCSNTKLIMLKVEPLFIFVFSMQLTGCSRTADNRFWKQLLYQLSHKHRPRGMILEVEVFLRADTIPNLL